MTARPTYDVMFFEALGSEYGHLKEEWALAEKEGRVPAGKKIFVTTETLQEYLAAHPDTVLPDLLSTKTHSRLPEAWLAGKKKSVITRSAGYDHFDTLFGRANITSLREYCVNAVAETALKLVFCACGNLNEYTRNAAVFERNACLSFKEMTGLACAVFGAGRIGKRIYDLCRGVGMKTVAVDLREKELSAEYGDVEFVSRDEATRADVVICAMNYTADPSSRYYNRNYFSEEYLSRFPEGAVFVNVTRGEIAPEAGLLSLYQKGRLFGVGLDVFGHEAGVSAVLREGKKPQIPDEAAAKELVRLALSREGNIYVQPHQAFNSDKAALTKAKETLRHIEAWYKNGGERFDSQLPYYE